ncbi:hypothetical protein ABZZ47_25975 [Streptomyces sp. NPDC006465]|uniref:hypothetical protein n=1 Tax=Streptomyces sp. NPDC006465 TaxID=3157174 RepID=UPI0033B9E8F3
MYNYAMTTRPTQAMWWAEMAIALAVAAATFTALVAFLGATATQGRHVTLDGGASLLLIALSIGVGMFASSRFRAWGLRRQAAPRTQS